MSLTDFDLSITRLNKLLGSVIISQGGVVPHIAPELCTSTCARSSHCLALTPPLPSSSSSASQDQEGRRGVILLSRILYSVVSVVLHYYLSSLAYRCVFPTCPCTIPSTSTHNRRTTTASNIFACDLLCLCFDTSPPPSLLTMSDGETELRVLSFNCW